MNTETVTLTLKRSEALVLFEWLARSDDDSHTSQPDEAEQKVLWQVEGLLEPQLVEIVKPRYSDLLNAAKIAVLAGE